MIPNSKLNPSKLQCIEDEIKINIFKYVDYPLNLAITCRNWSVIAKDPYAKTEWLIVNYGKAHALFHAVRLGSTYIDIPVYQNLIGIKDILPRYFIQRLLMHFGKHDQKLIELKIEHNADRIRAAFQQSPWTSNFPIFRFTYLLDEVYKQLASANENLPSKSNDMELFHFLSAGPRLINYALKKHLNGIRFTPFPHRPRALLRRQGLFPNRSLTVLTLFTNNVGIFGARPSRQRQNQLRRRRNIYRRRQHNAPINNEDTLYRIENLSQQVTNDPLINQLFNGSSFI